MDDGQWPHAYMTCASRVCTYCLNRDMLPYDFVKSNYHHMILKCIKYIINDIQLCYLSSMDIVGTFATAGK